MTLAQIIKKKLERLESVPDSFVSRLTSTEKDFFTEVLKLISKLEVEDGLIIQSNKNFSLLAEIQSKLKSLLLKTDYPNEVKSFISEFDAQAKITNDYFLKAFEDSAIPEVAKKILAIKKETTANLLLGSNLDSQFINAIKNQVELAVTSKAGFSETVDTLQLIITGNNEVDSKLSQYTKQIAYDSYAISDRAYTKSYSDSIGAVWFKWSGNVIATSRTICIENHNKFFHKKEIEEMASREWSGKIPGTNSETIFSTCGGFFCGHSLLPSSIFVVPKEVILRAIEKGFYKPTQFEIKELSL